MPHHYIRDSQKRDPVASPPGEIPPPSLGETYLVLLIAVLGLAFLLAYCNKG